MNAMFLVNDIFVSSYDIFVVIDDMFVGSDDMFVDVDYYACRY